MKSFESKSAAESLSGALPDTPLQGVSESVWKERKQLILEWSLAVVIALSAALFIRGFLFEAFRIPSESMENTLLVGDFVLVSKLHYGPRLPYTLGVPFTEMFLPGVEFKSRRFPGFAPVGRYDVVVFNVPTENEPIDRKTHYIKRIVGLPGDSLEIISKIPHVNGQPIVLQHTMKQRWEVFMEEGGSLPVDSLNAMDIQQIQFPRRSGEPVSFEASFAVAKEIEYWPGVLSVVPKVSARSFRTRTFPEGSPFNLDNYGPLYVPAKGDTIHLHEGNWKIYEDIITKYEGHEAVMLPSGKIEIDGALAYRYVIKQDYYFAMGDNRDSSLDSRTWGFVPRDHVVGKALMIYFSWDVNQKQIRKDRLLKRIE